MAISFDLICFELVLFDVFQILDKLRITRELFKILIYTVSLIYVIYLFLLVRIFKKILAFPQKRICVGDKGKIIS